MATDEAVELAQAERAESVLSFEQFCHQQRCRLRYRLNASEARIRKAKFGDDETGRLVVSTRGISVASRPVTREYQNQFESEAIRRLL